MAKWGEGDPRWIVEERPDATNVNNWHWTEKNATFWSRERFDVLLKGFQINFPDAIVEITDVQILDGEASANNRKGKLIFFYEWNLSLKWEGRLLNGSGLKIEGKCNIPNLSEEHEVSEIDVVNELLDHSEEGEILKKMMHELGRDRIRDRFRIYINELKEEFSKGLILPKKGDKALNVSNVSSGYNKTETSNLKKKFETECASKQSMATSNGNSKITEFVELQSVQKFQCDAEHLFRIMTTKDLVQAFTHGPVQFEACENGRFSLFGGNITGYFEKLIPNDIIVQKWRYKCWPDNHYSTVTLKFVDKKDHVQLEITQNGVPKNDSENTQNNWNRYYWSSIRSTFSLGVFLNNE